MKGKNIKVMISGVILAMSLLIPRVALGDINENFKEIVFKQTVENNKVWNVKFNKPVDNSSINSNHIFVENTEHKKIPVKFQIEGEGKEVKIIPLENYQNGGIYYLYILDDIGTKDGNKGLRKGIKMQFKIGSNEDNYGIAYFPLKYDVKENNDDILVVQVKNQNETPLDLTYTSGQKYELKLYKNGKVVYVYSSDKSFIQAITEKTIKQGEAEEYTINLKGLHVDPGTYEYEFYSTAKELSDLQHLKGTIDITSNDIGPINNGIAYFPLKYDVKENSTNKLIVEVKNQNERPLNLTYSSGQKYELKLYKDGEQVYKYSDKMFFTQAIIEKTIKQGEAEVYTIDLSKLSLAPGTYKYEFYSTAKQLSNLQTLRGTITLK